MRQPPTELAKDDFPTEWYNVLPDLPKEIPPFKDPDDGPSRIALLPKLFTKASIGEEFSRERWIPIPEEVREIYLNIGRPRPLYRAQRLEEQLGTTARIYYKREDLAPMGSFKLNSLVPQVYWAMNEGFKSISAYTGAGQVATGVALATRLFGLRCKVFWVTGDLREKPTRRKLVELHGAEVIASPSLETSVGRKYLQEDPEHPGTIGIAAAESFETALRGEGEVAVWGSRMNHVILHNTLIGLEVKQQLSSLGVEPDLLVGCVGSGSNLPGLAFPFLPDILAGKIRARILAVQSEATPSLVKGQYRYDHVEPSRSTPMMKVYTLGSEYKPQRIRAEGIRSNSVSPALSLLRSEGYVDVVTYPTDETLIFEAAKIFLETEGLLVAPESAYAIRAAIDEAVRAKRKGASMNIVVNVTGSGYLDPDVYIEKLLRR